MSQNNHTNIFHRYDLVRVNYTQEVGSPNALYDIVDLIPGHSERIMASRVLFAPGREIVDALNTLSELRQTWAGKAPASLP